MTEWLSIKTIQHNRILTKDPNVVKIGTTFGPYDLFGLDNLQEIYHEVLPFNMIITIEFRKSMLLGSEGCNAPTQFVEVQVISWHLKPGPDQIIFDIAHVISVYCVIGVKFCRL